MRQLRQEQSIGYKSMSRIMNTILSSSIPNPQYKKYLNGRLTLTIIIPSHPSRCESWNDYQSITLASNFFSVLISHDVIKNI